MAVLQERSKPGLVKLPKRLSRIADTRRQFRDLHAYRHGAGGHGHVAVLKSTIR